jgi:uncharacterized membrane protein
MKTIPLDADVECTDGPAGHSTAIIVDPASHQISHFVVREQNQPHTPRLVPLDRVSETGHNLIRLNCTCAELANLEPFADVEYRTIEVPHYESTGYSGSPYYMPEITTIPVEHEYIPPGMMAVRPGTLVEATDGAVGQVDELLTNPDTGQITHLVLRQGHLWGQKAVLLPLSFVKKVENETVYLTLDKHTFSNMLAVPVKQYQAQDNLELIVLTFAQVNTAAEALKALKQVLKKKSVNVFNAAALAKNAEGETLLKEMADVDTKHGALFGAITGGLIGMLGGPVGAVVGAVAGAASGGAAARWIDMGFPDDYLKSLQDNLQPGSSALVMLAQADEVEKVALTLAQFGGQLLHYALTDDMVAQLTPTE